MRITQAAALGFLEQFAGRLNERYETNIRSALS
jgi:hypothetical protein